MDNYAILSKAIDEVFEPQLDAFLHSVDFEMEHIFSAPFERKMEKLVKRRNKPYFRMICTAGRRTACIIILILVLSVSSLTVKAVREAVYDFISTVFGDHVAVSVSREIGQDYPTEIEDVYEITDLPDGFEMTDYKVTAGIAFCEYLKDDKYIFLDQYVRDGYAVNFDNEHSYFETYTDETGREYLVHNTGHSYCFIWDNGDYILQISSNLDKDDIVDLCKSTKKK